MDRLKLIDDIRKRALSLMNADTSLSYEAASREAKIQITGDDILITGYHQGIDLKTSYIEIARRELNPSIRVDLYKEEQLKEMIVATRLGVDLEKFVNIFQTPDEIRSLTLDSLKGEHIAKYTTSTAKNELDLKEEKKEQEPSPSLQEKNYQKKYTRNEYWNVAA